MENPYYWKNILKRMCKPRMLIPLALIAASLTVGVAIAGLRSMAGGGNWGGYEFACMD